MPRESLAKKRERALVVAERMNEHFPAAECALHFDGDPFRLTIAVLLSAQTTDAGVNKVTPELWERYPTPAALAAADVSDVERILRPIGFFHTKAANCIKCAQMVVSEFAGQVPHTFEELERLPGVGHKTANIVLNTGFGIVEGIAVDTHVFRIAHRLKLSNAAQPLDTEQDLLKIYPRDYWGPINHQWVLFGRQVCTARNPSCETCFLGDICPSFGKAETAPKKRSTKGKKTAARSKASGASKAKRPAKRSAARSKAAGAKPATRPSPKAPSAAKVPDAANASVAAKTKR